MNGKIDYAQKAKALLRQQFKGKVDSRGYVAIPKENLVPGVIMEQFESDLLNGDGGELRSKFCALHSSSALAINHFAPFKDRPQDLILLGRDGFESVRFEEQLGIGFFRKPNLDAYVTGSKEIIGIESKFLEYLKPKKGEFKAKYTPTALPWVEECWWNVWNNPKVRGNCYLDVAQLAKHYFGLSKRLSESGIASATLLYLFWLPTNAPEIAVCQAHQEELKNLEKALTRCRVSFRWLSYPDLWNEWERQPQLRNHVQNLRARYSFSL